MAVPARLSACCRAFGSACPPTILKALSLMPPLKRRPLYLWRGFWFNRCHAKAQTPKMTAAIKSLVTLFAMPCQSTVGHRASLVHLVNSVEGVSPDNPQPLPANERDTCVSRTLYLVFDKPLTCAVPPSPIYAISARWSWLKPPGCGLRRQIADVLNQEGSRLFAWGTSCRGVEVHSGGRYRRCQSTSYT